MISFHSCVLRANKIFSYLSVSFYHFVFKMLFFLSGNLKKAQLVFLRYTSKYVFLKISHYSQENTCVGVLKAEGL